MTTTFNGGEQELGSSQSADTEWIQGYGLHRGEHGLGASKIVDITYKNMGHHTLYSP